tara:strand:- start:14 stop:901 length:888 start_codon:yes stop_codon:yes gene_type:complete
MKYHLIIGFGKWSKKIINFLEKKKIYSKIYVKLRKYYFELGKNIKLSETEFNKIYDKIETLHICSPARTHFRFLKKNIKLNRIIIEKPFLNNLSQFKNIQNLISDKNFLLVNYTYLFSPITKKIPKEINKKSLKKITINFSNKDRFYKKKFDSIYDWLDHPLSIILYLFKKFPKSEIKKVEIIKNKGFYEKIIIDYNFDEFMLKVKINNSNKNVKNLSLNNGKIINFNFKKNLISNQKKKIYKGKITSFDTLYSVLKNKTQLDFQTLKFHKNILIEKNKILKKIKKYSQYYDQSK